MLSVEEFNELIDFIDLDDNWIVIIFDYLEKRLEELENIFKLFEPKKVI